MTTGGNAFSFRNYTVQLNVALGSSCSIQFNLLLIIVHISHMMVI